VFWRRIFSTLMVTALTGWLGSSFAIAQQQSIAVNRGVVELETSTSGGASIRIAEDLANLVDDGATRRVVPIVGKGALQNLTDLKYLRGVDLAIMPVDVLDYVNKEKLFPAPEKSFTYITKLYNEEFHLLVRPEIKQIGDLARQKVNVDIRGSGTAITAARIFDLLKLPVSIDNDPSELALNKLRSGDIAALALVSAKPAPLLTGLQKDEGLHLLDIPFEQLAAAGYLPARFAAADYPALIGSEKGIESAGVGTVLLAADLRVGSERFRNLASFVEAFFTGFQGLLTPGHHPKWQEVNLAADLPGWRRFGPADAWLQRNMQIARAPTPDEMRIMFSRFVDERRQATGSGPMTPQEKDELFQQFRAWQSGRSR
jgi:TRAP-type uncharacterized transport system substrate-binding protein